MFVHLHCHSYYSFLRGVVSPARLARRAAELGMPALALTDTDGVYGAVEFYRACREEGIKPILGVELTGGEGSAVFLARDRSGWEKICELTTARQLKEGFSIRRAVREAGENVFILIGCPSLLSTVAHCPLPTPYIYLEMNTFQPARTRSELMELARKKKLPLVAANDVHFLKPGEWPQAKVLAGIRTLSTWNSIPPEAVPSRQAWFKNEAGMEAALGEYPEALSETGRIAAAATVELELGALHLPRYPLPPGTDSGALLAEKCRRGVKRRYGKFSAGAGKRLRKELKIILDLGLADYFLLVEEIVRFARRLGIPTLGRGSAANSLVCYLLGITDVEPLKHRLYFERFLNPARSDPPDIDLDFPSDRRDEVIERIYRRFGRDRVAMLSTTVRFRARSALRETARVMGIGAEETNRLTRHLPYFSSLRDPERIRGEVPECRSLPWGNKEFRSLLRAAAELEGFPRHLSVHPGGVVIAPAPLTRYLALERAAKGIVITQPDMYSVKELGLIKIDVLGQRSLAVVEEVVREEAERGVKINFAAFDPAADEATGELVGSGRTIGCFYIESPVMRTLLKRLKCRDFETLVAASSIIRPGVSNTGLAERYIARHLGKEKITSLHPRLDGILEETHGVMIYQEQVMKVLSAAAGMSLAEADHFRRCMSKKPGWTALENYRQQFQLGAGKRKIPPEVIDELWRQIEGFSAYAFCKAHSASFALLSFRAAYLKAHFPAAFMAALISHRGGFYPTAEYVEEARRMGLEILPPDVNRCSYKYRAEKAGIRVGLMEIRHLRRRTARAILREREKKPFISWADFIRRTVPDCRELKSLIRSGALDSLGESRTALLWKASAAGKRPGTDFLGGFEEESGPGLPSFAESSEALAAGEREELGFPLSPRGEDWAGKLKKLYPKLPLMKTGGRSTESGEEIQFIGRPVTGRLIRTNKGGKLMKFLTLDGPGGPLEVVIFPDCYARYGDRLRSSGPIYVRGRLQVRDSAPVLICHFLAGAKDLLT